MTALRRHQCAKVGLRGSTKEDGHIIRAQAQGAGAEVQIAGLGRTALAAFDQIRPDGAKVLAAIRPESLTMHLAQPAGLTVAGQFVARQYLGGRQLLHVQISGRDAPVAVAAPSGRNGDPFAEIEGKAIWLSWTEDAITLLDPE